MPSHHIHSKNIYLTVAKRPYNIWQPFLSCPHHLLLCPCSLMTTTLASLLLPKHSRHAPIIRCLFWLFLLPGTKKFFLQPYYMANFLISFKSSFQCQHLNEDDFDDLIQIYNLLSPVASSWLSWVPLLRYFGYISVIILVNYYLSFVKA